MFRYNSVILINKYNYNENSEKIIALQHFCRCRVLSENIIVRDKEQSNNTTEEYDLIVAIPPTSYKEFKIYELQDVGAEYNGYKYIPLKIQKNFDTTGRISYVELYLVKDYGT